MQTNRIQCGAGLSTAAHYETGTAEVCRRAMEQLGGATPDLAVVFASPHHREGLEEVARGIRTDTKSKTLIGCTGESIVGGAQEIEGEPALSLWLAAMPEVEVVPFHLTFERTLDGGSFLGWPDVFGELQANEMHTSADVGHEHAALLMLGDPFTFPADALLERLNEDHPGLPAFGGMASAATAPGENRLLLDDQIHDRGAVAVLLRGPVRVAGVTSQGCRPIGSTFVITKAERNVIFELGGAPAMDRLKEIFQTLPARDQQLVNSGLHVGRVMSEYQDQFEQGDFLIKNVVGVDPNEGAIAIGDFVRVGQTVQFHVRDEHSADAELNTLLAGAESKAESPPAGGLIFTCNGRGTRMFSTPDHDAAAVQGKFAPDTNNFPLAGFFAAGEIGPVGGKNYIHGFTASVALFS